jgi:ATP-binding cassette subfamily C (CFTR/MRP) protein 1
MLSSMASSGSPSWASHLVFSWVTPLIKRANRTPLTEATLPALPPSIEVTADSELLRSGIGRFSRFGYFAILCAIVYSFRRLLLTVLGLSLLALTAGLSNPLILREILRGLAPDFLAPRWFNSLIETVPQLNGWLSYPLLFSLLLGCSSIVIILATHHLFYIQPNLAFRIRAALNALIFSKSLKQQRAAHQEATTGFIVNLIGSDTQKIQIFLGFLHSVWYHPLSLTCIIYLLHRMVGAAALVGSSALLVLLLISTTITRKQGKLRSELSKVADRRIGLTRETLIHIKAAKLQGWEDNLEEKIQALRNSEITLSRKLVRLSAIFSFTSGSAPAVAMALTSVCLVYQGTQLQSATLFPVLTLFMQLRFSLNILPDTIYNLMEALVASRRIHSFLSSPEHSPPRIDAAQGSAISLVGIQTRWSPGSRVALAVPSLEIPRGQLVVVVGAVGSGKSGLLLTILGELDPEHGSVSLGGSVAYVPQTPWIISDSIRNNILFGKPFDATRFHRALSAAGLEADLRSLPHQDGTQIGERGINLSGGQRQRVALARAAYSDAEIYLFDDPLSALDPNVAHHVFSELICTDLRTKTRVLVSHRIEFAASADRVLVVENGVIVEDGSPQELQVRESRFAALLSAHTTMTHTPIRDSALDPSPPSLVDSVEDANPSGEIVHNSIIEAEERRIGSVRSTTVRAYAARLAPGFALAIMIALFFGRQGTAVSTDLWLTSWTNRATVDLLWFLVGYLVLIFLLCLMGYLRTTYILSRGLQAGAECHRALLRGVLRAPLSFFESNPVGRMLNRFSRDLETVELSLPRSILEAGQCLFETAAVSCVIAITTPITLLLFAPLAFVYFFLSKAFRPVSRELQRLISITLSPVFAIASESLSGVESLRASDLGQSFNRSFARALNSHNRCNFTQTATNRWLGVRLEALGSAIICAVGIAASCGWSTSTGIAFSGLALAYASAMTSSMNWAIRSISMVENSLTSFERIERYSSTPSERLDGIDAPADWPSRGEICFRELSVRYRPHLPLALKNLTCTIPAGSRVGVIGRTGSGKSTLILSLLRLIEPCGGHIEIDGVDLSLLTLDDVRRSLAVVPQEPVLFSGTLRDSLDPFREYLDSDIESALERVELKGFLAALPHGLNSEVREGGFNFSNGQRQLICLARAILRRSKVVILDEATASIDLQTDRIVQRTIRREFTGATLIVIAHRIGTVLDSDLILSLHDGQLAELGPPEELLRTPSSLLYRFTSDPSFSR